MQAPTQPSQPNRLHAEMPRIPGVSNADPPDNAQRNLQLLALAAVLVVGAVVAWLVLRSPRKEAASRADTESTQATADALPIEPAKQGPPAGPQSVATLDQLAAPWSSKRFTFVDPDSHETVPAIVIHVPIAAASRPETYWAFSLNAPYQTCQLDYVTSTSQIASKYGYHATHPMVVAPCDGSIYDPLQVGSIPSGAWVRGQVVKGGGIRPPLAIDIRISGRSLIADKIE